MGAPTYIVENPVQPARSYTSAPRVPTPWKPGRPGELNGPQPWGDQLGTPGPDTGYALKLVERCVDELTLGAGEHRDDVASGLAAVAAKRAASYGRAPVRHDLDVAVTIWGFGSSSVAPELAELRRRAFEGVADPHHYQARRALVDLVPEASLRQTPGAVAEAHAADWRSLFDLGQA
ncbi:MAG: hypothetical protein IPH81_05200 [Candidatus Microthrix sp.]|nr:hypothetical protein [Candidatus Microthrix sp.]MBK7164685.1 hypothetical protein [Candidatus Microthrix sp.]